MSYQDLVAEHEAIEHAVRALMRLTAGQPRADVAFQMLEDLARLVRDHLSHENPVIYATVDAVSGGRHHDTAHTSLAAFKSLKADWCDYLDRWDRDRIARDWAAFGSETKVMLARLNARVSAETAVLYSLAVHHDLLSAGPSRPEP